MQNITQLHPTSHFQAATKALTVSAVGGVVTFGLFALMQHFIDQDAVELPKASPPVVINTIYQPEEEKIIEHERVPPPPEPQKAPETRVEVAFEPTDPGNDFVVEIPKTQTIGLDNLLTIGTQDSELRPIVRVDPRYPNVAARDGIEGWVKMTFNVNELGGVTDIQIVDAEPNRVFNKEAKRALSRWKYKPKSVDGQAVAQNGLSVVLEFTLADN